MTTETSIAVLFEKLDAWRQLPAYQLERRADVFFALYLDHILLPTYPEHAFDLIVPEFPLRLGSLYTDAKAAHLNLSVKVDYACFDTERKVCVLLELKTDDASTRDLQFQHMEQARAIGLDSLLGGILHLRSASKSKRKYKALVDLLVGKGLLSGEAPDEIATRGYTVQLAIIKPRASTHLLFKEPSNTITFAQIQERIASLVENDAVARHFSQALGTWQ